MAAIVGLLGEMVVAQLPADQTPVAGADVATAPVHGTSLTLTDTAIPPVERPVLVRVDLPVFGSLMVASTASAAPGDAQTIEGYTTRMSVVAGDTFEFCVSTDSPTYTIEIVRETEMALPVLERFEDLPGGEQPLPVGMAWRGAQWDVTFRTTVPASWPTGSYRARFRTADGTTASHPFVVRPSEPGATSRMLFVANYATRQAYNVWGGKNMYYSYVPGDPVAADIVSFLRPITPPDIKAPHRWMSSLMHGYLEQAGYTLEYLTEWDLHLNPCVLGHYDVIVFAGHHEYISRRVYDAMQIHQDRGGHMLFFSGDDLSWQVRYEDDGHTLVCYKHRAFDDDPMLGRHDCLVTTRWWFAPLSRPPELLTGNRVVLWSHRFEHEDFIVQMASHWMFEGTGLQNGDALGTLLSYHEGDNVTRHSPDVDVVLYAYKDRPLDPEDPPGVDFVEVAATYFEKGPAYGFPDGHGGSVFAAATLYGWMLAVQEGNPGWQDVRRVTRNLVDHMLAAVPPEPPATVECPFHAPCFLTVADLNDDGEIGFADLTVLLGSWGPCDDCVADIDNDRTVGFDDLVAMLAHWAT
jgi:hypothetical protein